MRRDEDWMMLSQPRSPGAPEAGRGRRDSPLEGALPTPENREATLTEV